MTPPERLRQLLHAPESLLDLRLMVVVVGESCVDLPERQELMGAQHLDRLETLPEKGHDVDHPDPRPRDVRQAREPDLAGDPIGPGGDAPPLSLGVRSEGRPVRRALAEAPDRVPSDNPRGGQVGAKPQQGPGDPPHDVRRPDEGVDPGALPRGPARPLPRRGRAPPVPRPPGRRLLRRGARPVPRDGRAGGRP